MKSNEKKGEPRVAVDFGSGSIKIVGAYVNPEEGRTIEKPFISEYSPLYLVEHIAFYEGVFQKEMEDLVVDLLLSYKAKISSHVADSVKYRGIATAVFRKALNSASFLETIFKRTGIPFEIISQEREGALGFLTGRALYPEINQEKLLVWDSGNASFQMTGLKGKDLSIHEGPFGHGSLRVHLLKEIRKINPEQTCVNPITREEALILERDLKLLFPEVPLWLEEKIGDFKGGIVSFGEAESIFFLSALAMHSLLGHPSPDQQAFLRKGDLETILPLLLEKEEAFFKEKNLHPRTLTSILLLLFVMRYYKIKEVQYRKSLGNTAGMFMDSSFWFS